VLEVKKQSRSVYNC